jgi:hypothetical protein
MSASELMGLAMLLELVGRWSHGKKAVPSAGGLVEIIFALLLISFLDTGKTQPIARGFAYVFLAAVLLGDNSPIQGIANAAKSQGQAAPAPSTPAPSTPATPAPPGFGTSPNKKGLL